MAPAYSIEASGDFERDFKRLDAATQERIDKKIRWVAAHPETLSLPLRHMSKDLAGLQKLRIGDYRVLLWVDHTKRALTLYAVAHRSTIYKRL